MVRTHGTRSKKRTCLTCGERFKPRGEFKGRIQKYCGKPCWSRRRPPSKKRCLNCRQPFESYQRDKVYCGQPCRDAHYRTRFKGHRSHRWRGGRTRANKILRTSAEFRTWREAVFERDDYTCVHCGVRSAKGVSVVIHPDHIKPLARFPELAFEVSNGRTLCASCHRKTPTWGNRR